MKKRIFNVITLILFSILILFIFIKILDYVHYKCIYRKLFGIYCAGCGTTRMIKSLFNLEFYQAFRYNPLLFVLFIIMFIYFIYFVVIYIKKNKIIIPNLKIIYIMVLILIIYMILRNLKMFSFLRPIVIYSI